MKLTKRDAARLSENYGPRPKSLPLQSTQAKLLESIFSPTVPYHSKLFHLKD